ncbi:class I SAM-dependent methyltransferase [Pseudofrankia asymbiotica]|uniref:SAM-dependent methyltransferase n=1 Tax=Pseudofrankia asymbiotica TaxID=1834516 RepID=A0A1V2I1P7_9ACTN|nr:SAM-dependent methyltransferase [Pseudofrankia asymbiotica]
MALEAGDEFGAGARLRAEGVPPGLVAAAFTQAELRRRAGGAFTRAAEMLFTRAGLEQSTAEAAARHRAARFAGLGRVADLCTGIGGDLLALAGAGHPLLAVDRDPSHLRIAVHNARVYAPEADIDARGADVRDVDLAGIEAVFVDPARRAAGRRFAAGTSEPPLPWCFALTERVAAVAVKAAPGLPTALVPPGWEIEFVADGRDLKEAVLFSPALAGATPRRATVLLDEAQAAAARIAATRLDGAGRPRRDGPTAAGAPAETSPEATPETSPQGTPETAGRLGTMAVTLAGAPDDDGVGTRQIGEPGAYLYDPSPAVTRAGLVGELARRLGAWQVDPMIAFLTSDQAVPTPFARLLRVEASLPFDVRRLAALLRGMGIGALDLRRRGLAGDVDTLRRRLLPGRRDLVAGGPAVTVVMTRHHDRPWALVCTAPAASSGPAAPDGPATPDGRAAE